MELPKVDPTKIEITNPQFRIVEKTDPSDGIKLYYPQRKWFGFFWIGIKRATSIQVNPTHVYWCSSYAEALEVIYKIKHKKEMNHLRKVYYL